MAATALAILPIVVAAVRAMVTDWVPTGDDAYFTLRSMDVATEHHPLLGAWSSGSVDLDRHVNNLGPLQLDLLAPFTRIAPMAGTAVGVAVVHIAAIVTIAWSVSRVAGPRAVLPAMGGVALMTWVMGSEMLITPRQHQYLLVPFLLVLVAAWAAAAGDRWALVPFVAAGSLVVQTHLSYPILVAGLAVPAVAGQVVAARRERSLDRWRRPWIVATALAAVLWIQTVVDQLVGWGNLGAVLSSPGETDSAGVSTGIRIVADVVAGRAGYLRPGYAVFDPNERLGTGVQVAVLIVVWIALAIAGSVTILRRGMDPVGAWCAVAWVAITAGVVTAAQLPYTVFGLNSFNYRWLWPIAAFLVLGALVAAERAIRLPDRRVVPGVLAGVLVVLAVVNLPEEIEVRDPVQYADWRRVVAEMTDQLADVDLEGPVAIDQTNLFFGHPFAYPVGVVLRDRGIDYRFDGEMQSRRFGESRVSDGSEPTRLVIYHGQGAAERWNDPDVVVSVGGTAPLVVVRETP